MSLKTQKPDAYFANSNHLLSFSAQDHNLMGIYKIAKLNLMTSTKSSDSHFDIFLAKTGKKKPYSSGK